MKKVISILLALVLVLSVASVAMADPVALTGGSLEENTPVSDLGAKNTVIGSINPTVTVTSTGFVNLEIAYVDSGLAFTLNSENELVNGTPASRTAVFTFTNNSTESMNLSGNDAFDGTLTVTAEEPAVDDEADGFSADFYSDATGATQSRTIDLDSPTATATRYLVYEVAENTAYDDALTAVETALTFTITK